MNLGRWDAKIESILTDLGRKIHLIGRWADAWRELHVQILGPRTESLSHQMQGMGCYAQFTAFFARMKQSACFRARIHDENRAAIRYINAQNESYNLGEKPIGVWHWDGWHGVNYSHVFAMNLISEAKLGRGESHFRRLLTMPRLKTRNHFRALVIHVNLRMPESEAMGDAFGA